MTFKDRDFLKLLDFTPEEIEYLIDFAASLKAKKKAGIPHKICDGKNVALIFEKTSTRTRCSFEVAARDLGMGTTYLDPSGSQIGKKESIADTARVLSGIYDGIEYRGFGQSIVEELAQYATVPVCISCQLFYDFLSVPAIFDSVIHTAQYSCGIGDAFFFPDLRSRRIKICDMHAQIMCRHLERAAGSGARFFKNQSDVFSS